MKKILIICLFPLLFSACEKTGNSTGDDRELFTGSWLCNEKQTGGPTIAFNIIFNKFGDGDSMVIKNFNNLGSSTSTYCEVSGTSVVIPSQSVTGIDVAGSGILSNDKINLNYTSDADSYTATCTPQ